MLETDLQALPHQPGVYMMLNEQHKVIYVGKAINLRNRVRSYFQPSRNLDPRIEIMVRQVVKVDYITTTSELEALILESNLIKEHKPKYNIRLRDDKAYPYLKVTWDEEYPRVLVVRRRGRDQAKYYGPYTDVVAMRETLRLLRQTFPVRMCSIKIGQEKVERPCLNFHIKRCQAPCTGNISKENYREIIKQVCLFLEGKQDELLVFLRCKMEEYANRLDYEKAAIFRDHILDVQKVQEKQRVTLSKRVNLDIIGLARNEQCACVQVFQIRHGVLNNREHYFVEQASGVENKEILTNFLLRYYAKQEVIPEGIIMPEQPTEAKVIETWLTQKHGRKVEIAYPQKGERRELVRMANDNAALLLKRNLLQGENRADKAETALTELAQWLGLPQPLQRIECFDISNTQGNESVASMVVFEQGIPAKKEYRKFKIKTVKGPDDFASLQEAVGRRFLAGLHEKEEGVPLEKGKFTKFPDLLVIDGGKGQLSGVCETLSANGITGINVVGLAKENEEVFFPGKPESLLIPRDSEALYLLQRVRDEAHRFALTFHRHLRDKKTVASGLDEIPGIGPGRKKALLRRFGSLKRIKEAAEEELLEVKGITSDLAKKIKDFLS